jgi:cytochrome oxidase assembly protein ShyY1
MRAFRPSLWSIAALLSVGSGLCSLGFWQVDRWHEVSAQKSAYDRQLGEAAAQANNLLDLQSLAVWRRVTVSGTYTGDQARVINKYIDGHLGVWLAAIMTLSDGSHLLVMRGWVPDDGKPWAPPAGEQKVTGVLRQGSGDLAAQISAQQFRSLAPHAILGAFDRQRGFAQVLIEGELVPPGGDFSQTLPRRGFYAFRIRRPHREYAGTWFCLAFALFLLWLYAGLRRGAAKEQP